jgi:hypothetical protein
MKTFGRILIILAVFFSLSGLMVVAVNASGSNAPDFDGAPQVRPGDDSDGEVPEGRVRPEGDENRLEHGDRGGAGGSRWMFGLLKNVGIMAVLVTIIVWPKSVATKKRKQVVINSTNSQP